MGSFASFGQHKLSPFLPTQHAYKPVEQDEEKVESRSSLESTEVPNGRPSSSRRVWFVMICSLALNVFGLAYFSLYTKPFPIAGLSRYAKLPYDTVIEFQPHSVYRSENQTEADELWDAIDVDPVVVALTQDEVKEMELPPSSTFPWEPSRSLYYLQSYHLLHCLKLMRRAYLDLKLQSPNPQHIMKEHMDHCFDMLRQYVNCHADDTPMGGIHSTGLVTGHGFTCRNMDKLREWAYQPERRSCYRIIDDYQIVENPIENFAFCPEDSPYYQKMHDYFKEHGHVNLFEEWNPHNHTKESDGY